MDSNGRPVMCRMDCGFYGIDDRDGMCSKCYKDNEGSRQGAEGASPDTSSNQQSNRRSGNKRNSRQGDSGATAVVSSNQESNLRSGNEMSLLPAAAQGRALSVQIPENTPDEAEVDRLASSLSGALNLLHFIDILASSSTSGASGAGALLTGPRQPADGSDSPITNDMIAKAVADFNRNIGAAFSDDLSTAADGAANSNATSLQTSRKRLRCHQCRKKVGLTGFACRCEGLFCSMHRYSDQHACTFDYKTLAQEDIRKNNPLVVAEKVREI